MLGNNPQAATMGGWPTLWYAIFVALRCVGFPPEHSTPWWLHVPVCVVLTTMCIITLGLFVAQTRAGAEWNLRFKWF